MKQAGSGPGMRRWPQWERSETDDDEENEKAAGRAGRAQGHHCAQHHGYTTSSWDEDEGTAGKRFYGIRFFDHMLELLAAWRLPI